MPELPFVYPGSRCDFYNRNLCSVPQSKKLVPLFSIPPCLFPLKSHHSSPVSRSIRCGHCTFLLGTSLRHRSLFSESSPLHIFPGTSPPLILGRVRFKFLTTYFDFHRTDSDFWYLLRSVVRWDDTLREKSSYVIKVLYFLFYFVPPRLWKRPTI